MRFSVLFGTIVLASTVLASPHVIRNDNDDDNNIRIFKNANEQWSVRLVIGLHRSLTFQKVRRHLQRHNHETQISKSRSTHRQWRLRTL
jgi:hypothetical protein